MTSEDSEVVDLYAICARAPASPAGDLRPPDLSSIAPPYTTDIAAGSDGEQTLTSILKRPRVRVALAGAAGVALLIGLVIGLRSAAPPAREALTASVVAAPPPPAPEPEEAPVLLPAAAAMKLPPPPTTGAPAAASPPPRAVAMRKAPAAAVPAGPKMTKIRSDGSVVR